MFIRYLYILIVFSLLFFTCTTKVHLVTTETKNHKTTDNSPADEEIEKMIQPYKAKMDKEMNVVIGSLAQSIEKQQPESTMGNFVSDLIFEECQKLYDQQIDFAVVNYGGLRVPSILAGDVTRGKIFELMPFDNMLVVLDLDGATTLRLFNSMADYGGWPISKQAQYQIVDSLANNIIIHNKPFDVSRNYKVAISDYIANGGDNLSYLSDQPRENLGLLFRDAILLNIESQNNNPIIAKLDGRVTE